jgi:hypothetical protein
MLCKGEGAYVIPHEEELCEVQFERLPELGGLFRDLADLHVQLEGTLTLVTGTFKRVQWDAVMVLSWCCHGAV